MSEDEKMEDVNDVNTEPISLLDESNNEEQQHNFELFKGIGQDGIDSSSMWLLLIPLLLIAGISAILSFVLIF